MLLYITVMLLNTHFKTNTIFCYQKKKKSYIFVATISPIFKVVAFSTFLNQAIPTERTKFSITTCSTYRDAQGPLAPCWLLWSSASSLGTDMWAGYCLVSQGINSVSVAALRPASAVFSHISIRHKKVGAHNLLPGSSPCPQPNFHYSSFCVHCPSCCRDFHPIFVLSLQKGECTCIP